MVKAKKNGTGNGVSNGESKKPHILLNAFDMSTVGHLSPGQWKVCPDAAEKEDNENYCISERDGILRLLTSNNNQVVWKR